MHFCVNCMSLGPSQKRHDLISNIRLFRAFDSTTHSAYCHVFRPCVQTLWIQSTPIADHPQRPSCQLAGLVANKRHGLPDLGIVPPRLPPPLRDHRNPRLRSNRPKSTSCTNTRRYGATSVPVQTWYHGTIQNMPPRIHPKRGEDFGGHYHQNQCPWVPLLRY